MLAEFPLSGSRYENFDAVREFKIPGKAFSFIYSVARETVWIIDLRGQRGHCSAEALRRFPEALR